ncbi:hypothetical protein KDAU_09070 [Dictyobacter aurantiacus]|uniref:Uncharacterized protein n=1 Tax=Dictyobacter aurantiacus TaxID=1936993 RepID=A0A401Z9T7_9CHLR|nr:hypothetical protein KDAU_09070 [Dictyobacter aurantiacus]
MLAALHRWRENALDSALQTSMEREMPERNYPRWPPVGYVEKRLAAHDPGAV